MQPTPKFIAEEMPRCFLPVVLVCALIVPSLVCVPAVAQSLQALTERALAHDAAWQAVQLQVDMAESRVTQARAGLLPRAGLQVTAQHERTQMTGAFPGEPKLHEGWQYTAGLELTQPLYRPENSLGYRQSQRGLEMAKIAQVQARQDLMLRTASAYFDLLVAKESLILVQAQKDAVERQHTLARQGFEAGLVNITDTREAQARLDLIEAALVAARNDVQVRELALEQITGVQAVQLWALPLVQTLPALKESGLAQWIERALADHPSLHRARMTVEVARLEIGKARAAQGPTVDLRAAYGRRHLPDGNMTLPMNTRGTNASVGIVATLPLYAGHALQGRLRETLTQQEKAEAEAEAVRRSIVQAVQTAFYGVQSALGQAQALEAAVLSSHSAMQATQLGYDHGLRVGADVLNAQSQWFQARRDLVQARYRVLLGQLQLRQAAGVLHWEDVQHISALLQAPSP